jgi:competence protein ComEA
LKTGSRVADALRQAGGARARAWLDSINLAAQLVDGQQVVVPTRPAAVREGGTIGSDLAGTPATPPDGLMPRGPISLNTATARELEQLPGVGPVTAEKIVAHREQHGPFRAVEELTAISGVGPARVEALRDLVAP